MHAYFSLKGYFGTPIMRLLALPPMETAMHICVKIFIHIHCDFFYLLIFFLHLERISERKKNLLWSSKSFFFRPISERARLLSRNLISLGDRMMGAGRRSTNSCKWLLLSVYWAGYLLQLVQLILVL